MESLRIIPDLTVADLPALDGVKNAEGKFDPEDERIRLVHGEISIGGMPEGTESGKPTVMIAAPLLDGTVVVLETTHALFDSAARALRAKYGEPV